MPYSRYLTKLLEIVMYIRLSLEEFISRSIKKHGNTYDYSRVHLTHGASTKVGIICPVHGEILQRASTHMEGKGCKQCANNAQRTYTVKSQALKKDEECAVIAPTWKIPNQSK